MQRLLLVVVATVVAFVSGRYTAPAVEAKPRVVVKREVVAAAPAVAMPCPVLATYVDVRDDEAPADDEDADDPDAIDVADTDAVRMLAAESEQIARIETGLGSFGGLRGKVRDSKTGENLPGVTIVATTPGVEGAQTAITDENGAFQLTDLTPGSYLVTIYYLDTTLERSDIAVVSRKVTPLFARIDSNPSPIAVNYNQGITINDELYGNGPIYVDHFNNEDVDGE